MVHGFGAESSYYSEQLLAVAGLGGAAYAVDLLGQGRSWPAEDPAPAAQTDEEEWGWGPALRGAELSFGEPAWLAQIEAFLHEVVSEPNVYLLGNSVGGYLACKAAVANDLAGLILVNATPFWGWFDPDLAPWDGHLPAPGWLRLLSSTWFAALRGNVETLLRTVYAVPDDAVVSARLHVLAERIQLAAAHPLGPAAFASILCAPKQAPTVGDALDTVAARGLPVLLAYGEEDPWVVPWWAQRAARRVAAVGEYYAISPAGHCPHHEAPEAFNRVLLGWLGRREGCGGELKLDVGDREELCLGEGRTATVERRL